MNLTNEQARTLYNWLENNVLDFNIEIDFSREALAQAEIGGGMSRFSEWQDKRALADMAKEIHRMGYYHKQVGVEPWPGGKTKIRYQLLVVGKKK